MKKSAIVMGCICVLAVAVALTISAAAQDSTTAKPATAPALTTPAPAAPAAQPDSPLKDQKEKVSYALGLNLANNLRKQSIEVDPDTVLQGLKDALAGGKTLMTEDEARASLIQMQNEIKAKQQEKMKEIGEANKKEGEAFLAANKTKEGVVTTASGLQYKVITTGTGPKPAAADTVVCNYKGTLINGTEFDSSYKRGQPATFPVNGVIKGWTEALQLMPVGSKWQLFIPPDLAYGERGAGNDIGPGATLIFEVEVMSIQAKQ
jgi:FKBP-type peptidyl-prolyl cis-trans isomerase FklB